MARYSDDSRERVRDAVDFVQLVGARTELRRAAPTRYTGLCPFHEERSPSFGINPVEKLYYCFGCGAGGDVFRFVMETEGVDFAQALELLADRFGVELEREAEDPRTAARRGRRDRLLALLERTAAYYVRLLWEGEEAAEARSYLASRGLEEAVLREFRVGYSPAAWDKVVAGSQRAGFTVDELIGAGLAARSRGSSGVIDAFRGRLMFPLADARGRVRGFGARALAEGDQPKYKNSSEGDVFSKGRLLFGTHVARAAASRSGSVVLVEGYTDVIALHHAGIRHAVGVMGTSLTGEQAEELLKLAGTVLLCLDADAAGQAATARSSEVAGARHASLEGFAKRIDLRVARLPAGTDPAELVQREGADAMRALLDSAIPFARFQVERALGAAELSSAEERDRALLEAAAVIRPLAPSVLREELVQLVAGRLGLSAELVAEVLGRGPGAGAAHRARSAGGGRGGGMTRALDRRDDLEHGFLALCLALGAPGARRLADADLGALFSTPLTRRAAAHVRDHPEAPAAGLPPDDPELSRLVAEIVVRAGASEEVTAAEVDRAGLLLDLARLDREIGAAKIEGSAVSELAAERQRVLGTLRKLPA